MRYRRAKESGATYFFTVNLADLADRHRHLLTENANVLRTAFRAVQHRHPFHIDAIVILPDHLHAVWTLPPDDVDYPTRWMLIKAGFSRLIPPGERRGASRLAKGERGIWQRRYWEHMIRDETDYARHMDYVHYNPVKHGYVRVAAEWPYSSIHRYIKTGILPASWGGCGQGEDGNFGER